MKIHSRVTRSAESSVPCGTQNEALRRKGEVEAAGRDKFRVKGVCPDPTMWTEGAAKERRAKKIKVQGR